MSEQRFFLAIKTSIGALCLPLSSRVKDLFFLRVELAVFELSTASVANMFH